MSPPAAVDRAEAADRLNAAWGELLRMGEHEGECDNQQDVCGQCGCRQAACSLHQRGMAIRMDRMASAVAEAVRLLRQ